MRYVPALIVDAVLVTVFALLGRLSHQEDAAGVLLTAWPFLAALVVGHLLAALLPGRPRKPWGLGWGVVVWVVTVAGGMGLRVAGGDTAEAPFVIVATLVLLVFLVGWRAITAILRGRRSRGAMLATGALPPETAAEAASTVTPVPAPAHATPASAHAAPAPEIDQPTDLPDDGDGDEDELYDIDRAPEGDADRAASDTGPQPDLIIADETAEPEPAPSMFDEDPLAGGDDDGPGPRAS